MGSSFSKPTKAQHLSPKTPASESPESKPSPPTIPTVTKPPPTTTPYIIPQLSGENLTIPGSRGAFRILASSLQTSSPSSASGIAVFSSSSVAAPPPGFHYHNHAHDIFLVTRGYLQLWNGSSCRVLGPGDFAYVPPGVIHNPYPLGPYTESLGLVAPGNWVDFFRHVAEEYTGVIVPESDKRDLKTELMKKLTGGSGGGEEWDVHFVGDYLMRAPKVKEWDGSECVLGAKRAGEGYFLKADTGPRWMLGGVMSRPFITAEQCGGRFAISSLESSEVYGKGGWLERGYLTFAEVHHVFFVMEGHLKIKLRGGGDWQSVRPGEAVVVSAGKGFKLAFGSRYVKVIAFASGSGLENLVHVAGKPFDGLVLPDEVHNVSDDELTKVCRGLTVQRDVEQA